MGQALITAYKRDNDGMTDNVYVEPDRDKKTIHMLCPQDGCQGGGDLYEPYRESPSRELPSTK